MVEKDLSFLTFQVERRLADRDEWTARNLSVHFKDAVSAETKFKGGSIQSFRDIGNRVAIVQRYEEGMIEKLDVDAVLTVDAPNLVLDEPFIFQLDKDNEMARSAYGKDPEEIERNRELNELRGHEHIFITSPRDQVEALQPDGFLPHQAVYKSFGKTLDENQPVRLKIQDMRPKPPTEVPPVEPVSKI